MRNIFAWIVTLSFISFVLAEDPFGDSNDYFGNPAPSCFTFEEGATCLSVSADTGEPSVEGAAAVTCSLTQDGCALSFACDEGGGAMGGTINGNILTLTNGATATIAADGTLAFPGILCAPPPTDEGERDNGDGIPGGAGNGAGEPGGSDGSTTMPPTDTTEAFAASAALTACSLPGSDSLPCGGPCEDGVCKSGECLVLPAGLGSACTDPDGWTGVCKTGPVGLVCEKPPCKGEADTTPCAVSNQCEKGICISNNCLSTPQAGIPCTATSGVPGLCAVDTALSSAPVCVEDPDPDPASAPAGTSPPAAADADAAYVTECTGATSGATCLSGPCTLGLCAQSYCVPLAFVDDLSPCGNGAGVCRSGQCAPAGPAGAAVTTQRPTTAAHFDAHALKSVANYDAPGTIRILGTISLNGVSLAQVQMVSILQRAISFALQLVAHDTLLPDPAVDLITVVLSGAHASQGRTNVDFSVVKLFGNAGELENMIAALSDADNAAYFFAQQSAAATLGASISSVSGVSSSIVAQPEVTTAEAPRNATMRPALDEPQVPKAGTSSGLVILACTFAFLIVAAAIIMWRHKNAGRDSFEVARKPVVPVDEYVPKDSYITVKNRGAYLRSEPLATAENFVSARHPLNRMKNRSPDHLPYDASRVILHEDDEAPLPCSDYINASHVSGFGGRTYIATQGPVERTVVDFWRMICEQACSTVVCMTRAEEGTAQQTAEYWPEQKDSPVTFGPFTVTLEEVSKNEQADAVVRKLVVEIAERQPADDTFVLEPKLLGTSVKVTMWQYLGFAEKFTPVDPTSLIAFRNAVRKDVGETEKPTVVHCNNGCGRTGVFIVLDLEMDRHSKENKQVDLYESVVAVRRSRPQLVDSKQQYVFLHRAFINHLLGGPNQVLAADLPAEQKEFLKNVTVSPLVRQDMPSFDIGLPGRKMLHVGSMELSSAEAFYPVELAIMSDIVVLSQVDGKARIVIAVGRRDTVVVKKDVKDRNGEDTSLLFRAKIGDDVCTFKAASPVGTHVPTAYLLEEKMTWVERLLDAESGFAEPVMNGERLVAKKPQFRRDALAIMQCPDPQSKEGSDEIKSEFGTIPLVFHAGPRSPTKVISGGQPRAIYMRPGHAAGAGAGSPPASLRTNNFFKSAGSPSSGNTEQSQANPSVMFGAQSPGGGAGGAASAGPTLGYRTNASVRAMPGLMLRATETVLAAKLGELEDAIEEAAKLEYIANGGEVSPPRGRPPPLFIDLDEETETEGLPAMRESYVAAEYDLESLPTSPIRPASPTRPASPVRSPVRSPTKRLSGLWKSAGTKIVRRSAAAERFAKGIVPVAVTMQTSKGDFATMPARRPKKAEIKEEKSAVQQDANACTHLGNCGCPNCA